MPSWFWLNIPAMVIVFSVTVGLPLWMVLKWPDQKRDGQRRTAVTTFRPSPSRPRRERVPQPTH